MSHPMAPGWTQTKKLALFTNLIDTKAPSNCIRKWYLRKCFEFFMIFFNDCSSFSFEEKTIPVFLRLGPCLYSVDWATSSHCPDGRNEFRGNRNDSKTAQLIFRGLEKKTREEKAKKDPFKKTKKMEKNETKNFYQKFEKSRKCFWGRGYCCFSSCCCWWWCWTSTGATPSAGRSQERKTEASGVSRGPSPSSGFFRQKIK